MTWVDAQQLLAQMRDDPGSALHEAQRWSAVLRRHALEADRVGAIPEQVWPELDVARINTVLIPGEDGGAYADLTSLGWAVVCEEFGYGDPGLAIALPGPGLSYPPIAALATPAQRRTLLSRFQSAEPVWGAFAITEPGAGTDATALTTRATRKGRDYVLDGQKCFITNGARADFVVVFATTDPARGRFGIRAFVVDRDTPGFSVLRTESMHGLRASQLAHLVFDGCRVPEEAMLGFGATRPGLLDAFSSAEAAWNFMRPLLASTMIGTARAIFDLLAHTLEATDGAARYGRAACEAALRQIEARIATRRMLVHRAVRLGMLGRPCTLEAAIAKTEACATVTATVQAAIDLLTAKGLRAHPEFEKWRRDVVAFGIMEGTEDIQVQNIVRQSIRRGLAA